ncbi:hypothetical protein ACFLU6_06885 [Acidobacteriota bacterium]
MSFNRPFAPLPEGAWFTETTEVDARAGGKIVLRWKDFGVDRYNCEHGVTYGEVPEP